MLAAALGLVVLAGDAEASDSPPGVVVRGVRGPDAPCRNDGVVAGGRFWLVSIVNDEEAVEALAMVTTSTCVSVVVCKTLSIKSRLKSKTTFAA